jgi:hypothetical protein
MLAGASAAYAQDVPPAQQPPAQTAATTSPAPGAAKPVSASPERLREVKVMEGILAGAVSQGASEFARQVQQTDPSSIVSINQARARGIALDGYGVLFDVDVPLMNLSLVLTERQMLVLQISDRISNARRVQARATAPGDRDRLDAEIQFLTRQLDMLSPHPPGPPTLAATPVAEGAQPPAAGSVVAQTVDVPPVAPVTRSPNEMYSDAIKKALIDAMVNHSSALMLADDEWLTVAARDNSGPTIPGTIDDRSGIILRIRGSDLAAFKTNKLNHDEVVKKVEIFEWR